MAMGVSFDAAFKGETADIGAVFAELYESLAERLRTRDARNDQTFVDALRVMFSVKIEQKEIADRLAISRMTINRWVNGETVPKAAPYREFLVGKIIEILEEKAVEARTGRPAAKALPFRKHKEREKEDPKRPAASKSKASRKQALTRA